MTGHGRVITVASSALDDAPGRMVVRALLAEGLPVVSRQVLDEDEAALGSALESAVAAPGLVVILEAPGGSGGEIVRRVLARLAGARLFLNDRLLALLGEEYSRRGQAMPRRLDRLGLLPHGAEIWPAADGPPGWALEIGKAVAAVLPQGSASLPALLAERVRPLVRRRLGGIEVRIVCTLLTAGLSAADAEERLGPWLGREGAVAVSTSAGEGGIAVRLSARGGSHHAASLALDPVARAIRAALGEDCYGRDPETLAEVVAARLLERGLTVSVAESGTGGLLGHRLSSTPTGSRCFDRGVIVSSDRDLQDLAGVPEALLRTHGAVSGPVAAAMATGVSRAARSSCGLAVTGIAGDEEVVSQPAGTVFVACAVPPGPGMAATSEARRYRFSGSRDAIRRAAAEAALDQMRRSLGRTPA